MYVAGLRVWGLGFRNWCRLLINKLLESNKAVVLQVVYHPEAEGTRQQPGRQVPKTITQMFFLAFGLMTAQEIPE